MKKVFFIIALLVLAVQVPAQGIYEAQINTINSIVRVWQDSNVIIYNEKTPDNGGFLLYTIGALSAKHFSLPDGISVNDFKINGKNVWFCGEKADNSYPGGRAGVVGTFCIPDVFYSNGTVNYAALNGLIGGDGYDLYIRGLNRLDLFESSYTVVMAMTGDNYIHNDMTQTRHTVVSAVFDPTANSWSIWALFDKDSTAIFTDIAALDNIVTAVGTSVDGTGLLAKSFYKSSLFLTSPTVPHYCDSIICDDPIGKAIITHISSNKAAVAQFNLKTFTLLHMLDFSSGTAVPSAPTRITTTPVHTYASPWNMQEIRHSRPNRAINVLEYGIVPGGSSFESLLWTFPVNTALWTHIPLQSYTLAIQSSMDVDIDNRPTTTGVLVVGTHLDIHSFNPGTPTIPDPLLEPDACTDYDEIQYSTGTPTVLQIPIDDESVYDVFLSTTYLPTVIGINTNRICE